MYPFQDPALSTAERVRDLLSRLTAEEKIGMLTTQNLAVERLGIGEWLIGTEVARGLVNREPSETTTVFPQPIGMAASFDKGMMYEIGRTAGREARAYYNEKKNTGLMLWGPTVDLSRDPRWGRNEECYGEDPCLTGEMSAAYTRGLRGEEAVWATIPTLKHFCANNHEEDRGIDNANLNPRLRHEYYYAAFRTPVKYGGAHSVMTSYNEICHAPAVMNHDLKDVLKAEWGLGFVVTDAMDFSQNVLAHQVCDSHAEALAACLHAGTDIMTETNDCVHAAARKALKDGLITEADIDTAVGNMLESRFLLGHFDPATPYDHLSRKDVNTEADRALNRCAAQEGIVLLDNETGFLPIDPRAYRKIGVFGKNADCCLKDWYTGYSGYEVTIRQGIEEYGCDVVCDAGWDIVRLLAPNGKYICIGEDQCLYADADAENAAEFYLCEHDDDGKWTNLLHVESGRYVNASGEVPKLENTQVYSWFTGETLHADWSERHGGYCLSDYLHGRRFFLDANSRVVCRHKPRPEASDVFRFMIVSDGTERIAALAKDCEAVVYCGGNDPMQVGRECFDRKTILLPQVQAGHLRALSDALTDTDIPLIFALVSSYPYAIGEVKELCDAIFWTCHAGPELGHAVADTIFGANNPAGRLPQTWYASDEELAPIGDYDIAFNRMTYRWYDGTPEFPFGFGQSYSRFAYSELHAEQTEAGIRITVQITNTSNVDGDEVVQVYAHMNEAPVPCPEKRLIAFDRIHIPAGETVTAELTAPFRELEIWDVSRERFCLLDGMYEIMLGASSAEVLCAETIHIHGETLPPRSVREPVRAELWDHQFSTEIFAGPVSGETHVRGMGWHNQLVFLRCELTGMTRITVRGAAPVEQAKVLVFADNDDKPCAEITLPPCDGFTDWHDCSAELALDGCHALRITFPQYTCIQSFWCS